ncbi:MAG: hypothetical protein QOE54_164 [Streptosporangiaceae bacterium]|nr:hypothetical protein [Streptosporangiaceae bacterium]
MSSVLTATGPQATYGNAEGSSNGFPAAVVPVANSGVVMVGEGPFSFLALVVGRLPMALISVGAWGTDATWLPAIARRAPTTVSAVGTPRTSPLAGSVRRLASAANPSTNHIDFTAGRGYSRPKLRQSRDPSVAKAMMSLRPGR